MATFAVRHCAAGSARPFVARHTPSYRAGYRQISTRPTHQHTAELLNSEPVAVLKALHLFTSAQLLCSQLARLIPVALTIQAAKDLVSRSKLVAKDAEAMQSMEVVTALESALQEAKQTATTYKSLATDTTHMNQALRHTNFNMEKSLREERRLRCELKLRIEKLKESSTSKQQRSDVSCDPAVERAAQQIIRSEEVAALEKQLLLLRNENTQLRAEVSVYKEQAETCSVECMVPL